MAMKTFLTCLSALWLVSCLKGESCTEIGCRDGASIRIETADNHWEEGVYELSFTVEGESTVCSLRIPEDLPPSGSVHSLECDPPAGYQSPSFSQAYTCTETRTDDAVSESCSPIPDEYELEMRIEGTPESADVRLERDGVVLVERSLSLTYAEHRPNGPGCEPLCRSASAVVEVP